MSIVVITILILHNTDNNHTRRRASVVTGVPNITQTKRYHAHGQLETGGLWLSAHGAAQAVAVAAAQLLSGQHGQAQRAADEGQAAHAEFGQVAPDGAQVPRGQAAAAA